MKACIATYTICEQFLVYYRYIILYYMCRYLELALSLSLFVCSTPCNLFIFLFFSYVYYHLLSFVVLLDIRNVCSITKTLINVLLLGTSDFVVSVADATPLIILIVSEK